MPREHQHGSDPDAGMAFLSPRYNQYLRSRDAAADQVI